MEAAQQKKKVNAAAQIHTIELGNTAYQTTHPAITEQTQRQATQLKGDTGGAVTRCTQLLMLLLCKVVELQQVGMADHSHILMCSQSLCPLP
jgi:hypothetical protein